jgi:selenium-binding protein 1
MIEKNLKRKQTLIFLVVATLLTLTVGVASADGFVHAPVIYVDGEAYYFAGAPDGPGGATDIPGHYWVQAGPDQVVGKHYNTGPFGAPQWWSSDAPDGELLFIVHGIIDTWSEEKAASYTARGYIHYHELVSVEDGSLHADKVVWLKHTARTSFNLDGGPHPELAHEVTPGLDYEFIPNGTVPYPSE